MIHRKKITAMLLVAIVAVVCVVSAIIYSMHDKRTEKGPDRKNQKSYYTQISSPTSPDNTGNALAAPTATITGSPAVAEKKDCKNFNDADIKSIVGDGYVRKDVVGSTTSFADLVTCTFTKQSTIITVVVYQFDDAKTAASGKKLFPDKNAVVIPTGRYVLSVSYTNATKYDQESSAKLASKLKVLL